MKWFYKLKNGKVSQLRNENENVDRTSWKCAKNSAVMYEIMGEDFLRHGMVSPQELILEESHFSQGEIRRAFRSIITRPAVLADPTAQPPVEASPAQTMEPALDALIASSPQMTADWQDEPSIDLNDPRVAYALSLADPPINVAQIKLAILAVRNQ